MATAVHIPISEYLASIYHPDCDYVDGEVQERNLGEQHHGLIQIAIAAIFRSRRREWNLRSITEQRVQVSATRFRIPDVCVVRSSDPLVGILRTPPVLCVEVLSPEDRFQRIMLRVEEYLAMGVPQVWIIDPESREAWTATAATGPVPLAEPVFQLPGTPVRITLSEIFEEIDEAPLA